MSRLLLSLLCLAPLFAFGASPSTVGAGRWDHLKKEIEELTLSVKSIKDPEKADRNNRLLQQKTRMLKNSRLLELGLSESDFRKLNQLQDEMDMKRHIMRNLKHSKDPRARITDEQRNEIHDLVKQIQQIQASLTNTRPRAPGEIASRTAIMRIREKIKATNSPPERRKLQKDLHELMEQQKRRNPGRPKRVEVSPKRLAEIRELREKISKAKDGPEKTTMRKQLKTLYDHSGKKTSPVAQPESISRNLTVEQEKRIAILRKQMAHAKTMDQKMMYRNHIKTLYDLARY